MKNAVTKTKRAGPSWMLGIAVLAGSLAAAAGSDATRGAANGAGEEEALGRPGRPVLVQPGVAPSPATPAPPARGGADRESLEQLERCLAQLRAADPSSTAELERCAKADAGRSTR